MADRELLRFVIHHSAVEQNNMDKCVSSFNKTHKHIQPKINGYGNYIVYHFLIGRNGEIRKTRPLNEMGYANSNRDVNQTAVNICLIGDFDIKGPSLLQLRACAKIINEIDPDRDMSIHEHREYAPYKTCPGKKFDMGMLDFYLDPKNYHIYKEYDISRIAKKMFVLDNKVYEYKQTANNCFLYEAIGVCSDNMNYHFSKKECLEIEDLARDLDIPVGEGGSNPQAYTVVREWWNANKKIKIASWIFDMSLKENRPFFLNRYSIGIQMGIDKDYVQDRSDGVLNDLHYGENGHSIRIRYNGKYIEGRDNYKGKAGNVFEMKNFSKRLGKEISVMGMTFIPEALLLDF